MTIENDKVTFEDKIVGVVKSVKIIDGNTHCEIEITDQDLIDKIVCNIPYSITILNSNGFGLNYKLPKKVLKSKKRRGV